MDDRGYQGPGEPTRTRQHRSLNDLVRGAAHRDPRCWEEIVDRFGPHLYQLARGYRLDEATCADVVQQVWLRALVHLPSLREPLALGGWLTAIAHRECLRALRDRGRRCPGGDLEAQAEDHDHHHPPEAGSRPEQELLSAELGRLIQKACAGLSARDRRLVALIVAEELSYVQMARELDLRPGSVGPIRARCLARLRVALADVGVDRTWLAA